MDTFFTVHAVAINKDNKILVLQRAKGRTHPGSWNCVTGHVHDRESAEQAALRELKEETNLGGRLIKTSDPFWMDDGQKRFVIVSSLIFVKDIDMLKIDSEESQDFRWVELTDPLVKNSEGLTESLKRLEVIEQ